MSSIGRFLSHRQPRRADPITLEEFGALLARGMGGGPSTAGIEINQKRALGITAWYSGVRYLAESLAYLPLQVFRRLPDYGRERIALPPWLAHPDAGWTTELLVESWMVSLLHRGFAAGFKLRNSANMVTGMRFLHPDRIKVGRLDSGVRAYQVKINETEWGTYTDRDVLWIPFLTSDGCQVITPLEYHRNSLGTVAAADELAGKFYSQGTLISDYIQLERDVPLEELPEIRRQFEEFHKGLKNARHTPVLSNGAAYKTIDLKADDAQLLESRQFGVTEVARILRIPPHKLYDLSRSTFSNIEHQAIESVTDSIRPFARRFESWISSPVHNDLLPAGRFVEFNLEGLLRGDIKTRYEAYQIGVNAGFLTVAEPRNRENLPPLDGMNVAYRPSSHHVIDPDTGDVLIPAGRPQPTGDKP